MCERAAQGMPSCLADMVLVAMNYPKTIREFKEQQPDLNWLERECWPSLLAAFAKQAATVNKELAEAEAAAKAAGGDAQARDYFPGHSKNKDAVSEAIKQDDELRKMVTGILIDNEDMTLQHIECMLRDKGSDFWIMPTTVKSNPRVIFTKLAKERLFIQPCKYGLYLATGYTGGGELYC